MVLETGFMAALAPWLSGSPTIEVGEHVFDEVMYENFGNHPVTIPARKVDTVLGDLCEEQRQQFVVTIDGPEFSDWPDPFDHGLAWTGYFAPIRSTYTTVAMWEAAFQLPATKGVIVEAYKESESGQKSYTRNDPDPETKKRIRRTYAVDKRVDYRKTFYSLLGDPNDLPGGGGTLP